MHSTEEIKVSERKEKIRNLRIGKFTDNFTNGVDKYDRGK